MNRLQQVREQYENELETLNLEIMKAQYLYKQITFRQDYLIRLLSGTFKNTDLSIMPAQLQHNEGQTVFSVQYELDTNFIRALFMEGNTEMTLQDVINLITNFHHEVLPTQIINVKSYIKRRLDRACDEGVLSICDDNKSARTYLLVKKTDKILAF